MEKAIITRLKVYPHPSADKLALGITSEGYNVVISKSILNNTLGVYFPCDVCLTDEFCIANNLYPIYDEEGKKIGGGFIDPKNRRVKAQVFRGQKSVGLWVPLSYFDYLKDSPNYGRITVEGYQFTQIDDNVICEKWLNTATLKAIQGKQSHQYQRKTSTFLPQHPDTRQLKYDIAKIPMGAKVIITEKLHGSSGRTGHVLETVEKPIFSKLPLFFKKIPILKKILYYSIPEWRVINGTRRVLVDSFKNPRTNSFYQNEEFRYKAEEQLKSILPKGFSIYYELVGYVNNQQSIMPSVSTKSLNNKKFTSIYGDTMTFSYGCKPGESKLYVYNILCTLEDGYQFPLTWDQIVAFCKQHNLETVPLLDVIPCHGGSIDSSEYLLDLSNSLISDSIAQSSVLDANHIREGVCLRVEYEGKVDFYKNKSTDFYILEGVIKDSNIVDIEEKESYIN